MLEKIELTSQSVFLLFLRLFWGWQFATTGWGKMGNIERVTQFFTSLDIPFPVLTAHLTAGLEFGGGILLFVGLASRPIALLLAGTMGMAYLFADREALFGLFSEPEKFVAAAPFAFLMASLLVLLFGPGRFSLDSLVAFWRRKRGSV